MVALDTNVLLRFLVEYETGKGDLADYVIIELGGLMGADRTATFDDALLKTVSSCFAP